MRRGHRTAADAALGRAGFVYDYGRAYSDDNALWKIDCIIFARDEACLKRVHDYAKNRFHELNDANRRYVALKEERIQNEYNCIVSSSDVVSKLNFILPETINGFFSEEGQLFRDHLYADAEGGARIKLDSKWEYGVIKEEGSRADFVCWLRNMPRQDWALCIPYEKGNEFHAFYPDFLIVRRDTNPNSESGYVVDILEPHNAGFADNLAKTKGLAKYAQEECHLGRIQMLQRNTEVGGVTRYRRLEFSKGQIREEVLSAMTNDELQHIFEKRGECYEPQRQAAANWNTAAKPSMGGSCQGRRS